MLLEVLVLWVVEECVWVDVKVDVKEGMRV